MIPRWHRNMTGRKGNIHTLDNRDGPRGWFESLPIITKWWFGVTLFITFAANFGFISPIKLSYNWDLIWSNFEIWRFISPFVFAGIFQRDMVALMTLYNLVTFSQHHEMGPYNTGAGSCTADYAFALMFGMTTIILTHPLMNMIMPATPCCNSLIFFVIYGWSKRYPNAPVSLWFFQMKAIQFPFAHVLFNVVTCRGISSLVHGIAVGHLYYFLVDVFPVVYGKDILHTPQSLIDVFGEGGSMSAGCAMYHPKGKAGMEGPTKKKRAHSWGTGQALGSM